MRAPRREGKRKHTTIRGPFAGIQGTFIPLMRAFCFFATDTVTVQTRRPNSGPDRRALLADDLLAFFPQRAAACRCNRLCLFGLQGRLDLRKLNARARSSAAGAARSATGAGKQQNEAERSATHKSTVALPTALLDFWRCLCLSVCSSVSRRRRQSPHIARKASSVGQKFPWKVTKPTGGRQV